jgi:tetratricopeptide (TPR) repeat protein
VLRLADIETAASPEVVARGHTVRLESIAMLQQLILNEHPASGDQKTEIFLRLGNLYLEEGRYFATTGADAVQAASERAKAIKLYRFIQSSFPQSAHADDATFYLGQALADAGQSDDAFTEFTRIVKMYPDSGYVPDAYIMLGEHHYERSRDADEALLAYQEAVAYTNHKMYGFALYKLAWCHYSVGDNQKAIQGMETVIAWAEASGAQTRLGAAARQALARFMEAAGH